MRKGFVLQIGRQRNKLFCTANSEMIPTFAINNVCMRHVTVLNECEQKNITQHPNQTLKVQEAQEELVDYRLFRQQHA